MSPTSLNTSTTTSCTSKHCFMYTVLKIHYTDSYLQWQCLQDETWELLYLLLWLLGYFLWLLSYYYCTFITLQYSDVVGWWQRGILGACQNSCYNHYHSSLLRPSLICIKLRQASEANAESITLRLLRISWKIYTKKVIQWKSTFLCTCLFWAVYV